MPDNTIADRIPDLLPDSFAQPTAPSPAEILERQAELLEAKTDGILAGRVRITRSACQFPWSGRHGSAVVNAFEVTVVATGTRHTLFNVVHESGKPYPLTVTDVALSPEIIDTESQFLEALRDAFNSAYCREVITELIAMGRSGDEPADVASNTP